MLCYDVTVSMVGGGMHVDSRPTGPERSQSIGHSHLSPCVGKSQGNPVVVGLAFWGWPRTFQEKREQRPFPQKSY